MFFIHKNVGSYLNCNERKNGIPENGYRSMLKSGGKYIILFSTVIIPVILFYTFLSATA